MKISSSNAFHYGKSWFMPSPTNTLWRTNSKIDKIINQICTFISLMPPHSKFPFTGLLWGTECPLKQCSPVIGTTPTQENASGKWCHLLTQYQDFFENSISRSFFFKRKRGNTFLTVGRRERVWEMDTVLLAPPQEIGWELGSRWWPGQWS